MGHRVLHQPTQPVGEVAAEVRRLVADMFDTMEAADGVGLAANQVGVAAAPVRLRLPRRGGRRAARRRASTRCSRRRPGRRPCPIREDDEEGCLSVPGEQFPTGRAGAGRGSPAPTSTARRWRRGHRVPRPLPAARDRPPRRRCSTSTGWSAATRRAGQAAVTRPRLGRAPAAGLGPVGGQGRGRLSRRPAGRVRLRTPGSPRAQAVPPTSPWGTGWPRRPALWSSKAWTSSARVFITNGPAHAIGSRSGRPPRRTTSIPAA